MTLAQRRGVGVRWGLVERLADPASPSCAASTERSGQPYTALGLEISCPNFVPLTRRKAGQGSSLRWAKLLICIAPRVALLTIYDMCKAVDRAMTINHCKLLEKHGGKSGSFVAA